MGSFVPYPVTDECKKWNDYIYSTLSSPFDTIDWYAMRFWAAKSNFATKNYGQNPPESLLANSTCDNRKLVQRLMMTLKTGLPKMNVDGINPSLGTEGQCGRGKGYKSWRAFTCGSARILCLDCKLTCAVDSVCPGAGKPLLRNPS
jgi:hypothetical protein